MPLHALDNPARHALDGRDSGLAVRVGSAVRFRPDVAPFVGLPDDVTPDSDDVWDDLAKLLGADGLAVLAGPPALPPSTWTVRFQLDGYQMTGPLVDRADDDEVAPLTVDDVPAMADLVARTEPGPFLSRTIEFGGYVGIRRDGRLLAMAGERMHVAGWTEVSAVCTDPDARGQGLARRIVTAVAAGIVARGERPFLHVVATNPAVSLYESMGFEIRRDISFAGVEPPKR